MWTHAIFKFHPHAQLGCLHDGHYQIDETALCRAGIMDGLGFVAQKREEGGVGSFGPIVALNWEQGYDLRSSPGG
jgi:hypothetical protein